MSGIIKAPTLLNSQRQIRKNTNILQGELENHLTDEVKIVYLYNALLFKKRELIFIRDSVSLIPLFVIHFISNTVHY